MIGIVALVPRNGGLSPESRDDETANRAQSPCDEMIRAVIFDVDGTLVDTVDFHTEAWQRTFREFGKEVAFDKIRFQIGKGGDQLLPEFWSEEELEELEEPLNEFRTALFKKEYLPRVQSFPKVRDLVLHLLAQGKKVALASSAIAEELETYKKAAAISDLIEIETSKDDAEKSKPHPDIFEAVLKKLGNPDKDETIVIGDTPWDIESASKAGLRTIAVLCGGFPEETLGGAVVIYHDPADLLARYAESPLAASPAPTAKTAQADTVASGHRGALAGAAGGAAAGAAAGAIVGGPLGAAVGAAVGGIAGGVTGGMIDRPKQDAFWEERFPELPYAEAGRTFEDYKPAFHAGYEMYERDPRGEKPTVEWERELREVYASSESGRRLQWERTIEAARDAYLHLQSESGQSASAERAPAEDTAARRLAAEREGEVPD